MRVENKRHTNADQPLTSHSTTEVSIPLSASINQSFNIYINMHSHESGQRLLCYCKIIACLSGWVPDAELHDLKN
jgi:hypothetical protein